MSALLVTKSLLSTLMLPPANGLLLLLLAGILRRRRGAFALAALAVLLLFAQSLPPVADQLIGALERRGGPALADAHGAGAIVVLGSGRDLDAPEYGGDTTSMQMLVRVRYGAFLARRLSLPVLVSGGMPGGGQRREADIMADILQDEFGVPVRWREGKSNDTADNAVMSALLLKQAGVGRVVLVTHAFHMLRARLAFEAAGIEVIPAPTAFKAGGDGNYSLLECLPSISAMQKSSWALHEWIGLVWRRLVAAF